MAASRGRRPSIDPAIEHSASLLIPLHPHSRPPSLPAPYRFPLPPYRPDRSTSPLPAPPLPRTRDGPFTMLAANDKTGAECGYPDKGYNEQTLKALKHTAVLRRSSQEELVAAAHVVTHEGALCLQAAAAAAGDGQLERVAFRTSHRGLLHVPPNATDAIKLPLLLFLHAAGEAGHDVSSMLSFAATGPLYNLSVGTALPALTYGVLVAAPQADSSQHWGGENASSLMRFVDDVIDHVSDRASIDRSRIFITCAALAMRSSRHTAATGAAPTRFRLISTVSLTSTAPSSLAALLAAAHHSPPSA